MKIKIIFIVLLSIVFCLGLFSSYKIYKKYQAVAKESRTTRLSWNIWDNYLYWLFDILFEVSTLLPESDLIYQKRMPGFIAERLLNLYFLHNKQIKISYMPVCNLG